MQYLSFYEWIVSFSIIFSWFNSTSQMSEFFFFSGYWIISILLCIYSRFLCPLVCWQADSITLLLWWVWQQIWVWTLLWDLILSSFRLFFTEVELLYIALRFAGTSMLLFKFLDSFYVITNLVKSSDFCTCSPTLRLHSSWWWCWKSMILCMLHKHSATQLHLSPTFSGCVVVFIMHIITGFWMSIFVSFRWSFICFLGRNAFSCFCQLKIFNLF